MCNLCYADLWIMPTIGSERALAAIAASESAYSQCLQKCEKLVIRSKMTGSGYRWSCRGQSAFLDSHISV